MNPRAKSHPDSLGLSRLLLGLGAFGSATLVAPAQVDQMNIGVRTEVTDGWVRPKGKQTADGGHSKLYGVLAVTFVPQGSKMVKPVDAGAMLEILHRELAANGFKQAPKGAKPDILLAVSYGRGWVHNPYDEGQGAIQMGVDAIPAVTITDFGQLLKEKQAGYMAKQAKAQYEKLFIRVTAFAFPTEPKEKPRMLWKTIIVADDPDNRDLNALMAQMLAAGAPLFDKATNAEEVDLYKPLPDGRVKVGQPEVVGSDVRKTN